MLVASYQDAVVRKSKVETQNVPFARLHPSTDPERACAGPSGEERRKRQPKGRDRIDLELPLSPSLSCGLSTESYTTRYRCSILDRIALHTSSSSGRLLH